MPALDPSTIAELETLSGQGYEDVIDVASGVRRVRHLRLTL